MSRVARAVVPVTWRLEPGLFAKVQAAAKRRGVSVQAYASDALRRAVEFDGALEAPEESDVRWLGDDLSRLGTLEPFDWGPEGPPDAEPIIFEPGIGFTTAERRP